MSPSGTFHSILLSGQNWPSKGGWTLTLMEMSVETARKLAGTLGELVFVWSSVVARLRQTRGGPNCSVRALTRKRGRIRGMPVRREREQGSKLAMCWYGCGKYALVMIRMGALGLVGWLRLLATAL